MVGGLIRWVVVGWVVGGLMEWVVVGWVVRGFIGWVVVARVVGGFMGWVHYSPTHEQLQCQNISFYEHPPTHQTYPKCHSITVHILTHT